MGKIDKKINKCQKVTNTFKYFEQTFKMVVDIYWQIPHTSNTFQIDDHVYNSSKYTLNDAIYDFTSFLIIKNVFFSCFVY